MLRLSAIAFTSDFRFSHLSSRWLFRHPLRILSFHFSGASPCSSLDAFSLAWISAAWSCPSCARSGRTTASCRFCAAHCRTASSYFRSARSSLGDRIPSWHQTFQQISRRHPFGAQISWHCEISRLISVCIPENQMAKLVAGLSFPVSISWAAPTTSSLC